MISTAFIKTILEDVRNCITYTTHARTKVNNTAHKLGLYTLSSEDASKLIRDIENHQCRFIQHQMKDDIYKIKVPAIGNFIDAVAERTHRKSNQSIDG